MKRRILTVVLILCLVLTAAAVAAVGTEGAVDPNAISQVQLNFDGGNVPVCPYCGTQPENGWTALDTDITQWQRLNGHYYLTGDRTNSSYYGVVGGNACVYFGDYDVTAANQFAFQVEGGTLTLMGRGDVTGNHNSSMNVGGTIDVVGGTLNLCGGTYRKGVVNGCAVLTMRSGAGTVHMYEGTTICEGNADIGNGGNVRIASGSAFYMHGGQIRDGIAVCGGNIAVEHEAAIFHMYGGTVSGGFAQLADGSDNDGETYALGGNIYVSAGSVKQEKGASISGGTAYTGGNIYFTGGKTVELAGTVSGGTAKTGGNLDIRAYSKAVLSAGAMVSGGTADYDGGNIQLYHATLEIAGGNVSGGTAGRWGGSIFADGENSQVLLRAGNISGGETTVPMAAISAWIIRLHWKLPAVQ